MADGGKLTPKQDMFVQEYLIDLNATQAAIRAGYSPATANEQGSRLLANASVAAAVERAKAERSARIGLTADRILEELSVIAFAHMGQFAEWGPSGVRFKPSADVDGRAVAEVKETTTQHGGSQGIKLHDKVASLKLLGQHIGMFVERHEHRNAPGEEFRVSVEPKSWKDALAPFLPPDMDNGDAGAA
jgi:phage terminase small subunit